MTKEEANNLISTKIMEAYAIINECEEIAETAGVSFSFDVAYGMGGSYRPRKEVEEDYGDTKSESWYESHSGWISSSSQC